MQENEIGMHGFGLDEWASPVGAIDGFKWRGFKWREEEWGEEERKKERME